MKQDLQRRGSGRYGLMEAVETPEPKTDPVSEPIQPSSDRGEGNNAPSEDADDGIGEADEENDDGEAEPAVSEHSVEPAAHSATPPITNKQTADYTESQIKMQQSALAAEYTKLARVFARALERRVTRVLRRMESMEHKSFTDSETKDSAASERPHMQRIKRLLWYQTTSIRANAHHEAQIIWRDFQRHKIDLRQRLCTSKERKMVRLEHDFRRSELVRSTDLPVLDWVSANLDTAYYLTSQRPITGLEDGEVESDLKYISEAKKQLLSGEHTVSDVESGESEDEYAQEAAVGPALEKLAYGGADKSHVSMELLSQLSAQQLRQPAQPTAIKTEPRQPHTPQFVQANPPTQLTTAATPRAAVTQVPHTPDAARAVPSMPAVQAPQAPQVSHVAHAPHAAHQMHALQHLVPAMQNERVPAGQPAHQAIQQRQQQQQQQQPQPQAQAQHQQTSRSLASGQSSPAQRNHQNAPQPVQAHVQATPYQPQQLLPPLPPHGHQQPSVPPAPQRPALSPAMQIQAVQGAVPSPPRIAPIGAPPDQQQQQQQQQQQLALAQQGQYPQYAYQYHPSVQYLPATIAQLQPQQRQQQYAWPGYTQEQLSQFYQQPNGQQPPWPQHGQYSWQQYPQ